MQQSAPHVMISDMHGACLQEVVANIQKNSSCPFPAAEVNCLEEMFSVMEDFHGKVLDELIAEELTQVPASSDTGLHHIQT